jgi:hypothetical protein
MSINFNAQIFSYIKFRTAWFMSFVYCLIFKKERQNKLLSITGRDQSVPPQHFKCGQEHKQFLSHRNTSIPKHNVVVILAASHEGNLLIILY